MLKKFLKIFFIIFIAFVILIGLVYLYKLYTANKFNKLNEGNVVLRVGEKYLIDGTIEEGSKTYVSASKYIKIVDNIPTTPDVITSKDGGEKRTINIFKYSVSSYYNIDPTKGIKLISSKTISVEDLEDILEKVENMDKYKFKDITGVRMSKVILYDVGYIVKTEELNKILSEYGFGI